jgi:hypothetical protein
MGPVIASIHDRRAQFRAEVQKLAPEAEIPVRSRRRLRERLGKGSREQEAADRGE